VIVKNFISNLIWGDPGREDINWGDPGREDIELVDFAKLSWEQENRVKSLEKLYNLSVQSATGSIDWYTRAKPAKKRMAQALRLVAILATMIGGVIPVLAEVDIGIHLNPMLASVAIAIAAGAVLLDRFFGYSASWIRFIVTKQKIQDRLQAFQYDWEVEQVTWRDDQLDDARTQELINKCAAFVTDIQSLVLEETQAWVEQFQTALQDIEQKLEAQAQVKRTGALSVRLSGADTGKGWQLYLDNRLVGRFTSAEGSAKNLAPNFYTVKVVARKGDESVEVVKTVEVKVGQINDVDLTLP
jgi:hypothetical protein